MKAMRYHGKHDLRLEDIPMPAVQPGTVKIKVEWTGICGTDLPTSKTAPYSARRPAIPTL
jgi:(R,R)-butanediol dehydrogenase/meso-butanediol dehydrogenase/diacetyl reductase